MVWVLKTASVSRRALLQGIGVASPLAALAFRLGHAQEAPRFDRGTVIDFARSLAAAEFSPPSPPVPPDLLELSSAEYQQIAARPETWLFTNPTTGLAVEPLHSGFIYREPVEIFAVRNEIAYKLTFDPAAFLYPDLNNVPPEDDLEFAGFRGHAAFGSDERLDPFIVFAGASYFQAISSGQVFGVRARGLAIGTGEPDGEEFPRFRAFWIEEPADGRMVVHALLDSRSMTGAYRFTIRPGGATVVDVEAILFARSEARQLGLAPLTSMYLFDASGAGSSDEIRRAVHNSDGLAIWNGKDEWLWRPLQNPRLLRISAFSDVGPRGFGLIQREKRFSEYEDLDARYQRRPSLWVEPIGDWGVGKVVLVEIPSDSEINDNVVAFWRPEGAIAAGAEITLTYRLTWGWDGPIPPGLLRVTRTLTGAGPEPRLRNFVVDYSEPGRTEPFRIEGLTAEITASSGVISAVRVRENPIIGGLRVMFTLEPSGEEADLRVELLRDGAQAGEVWLYLWSS